MEHIIEDKHFYTTKNCKTFIKSRKKETHKGSYGRIGIVAGSLGMTGSVCMSALSSLRSGSGLVYTVIPNCITNIVSIKLTESVIRPVQSSRQDITNHLYFIKDDAPIIMKYIEDCDCIVLGPGIGTNNETKYVVNYIMRSYEKPVVLDADGLNCISDDINILKERKAQTVITPHPKEFERLLSKSEIKYSDRIKTAIDFSKEYNVVTLLKGYHTVIANSNSIYYINPTGNAGMATAGSGDVLSGIIASFIGQGIDVFNAACCGAYTHGLAGDIAVNDKGEYGLIATDIIDHIPYAIKSILNDKQ